MRSPQVEVQPSKQPLPHKVHGLGVADSTLRRLETLAVVGAPARDTAHRRKWTKADIPKLRRRLAKYRKRWRGTTKL